MTSNKKETKRLYKLGDVG